MCFSLYLYFDVIFTGTSGWAHGDALVMCVCVCVCVFTFVLSSFKPFSGNYQSKIKFNQFFTKRETFIKCILEIYRHSNKLH